jgi:hypothetical protein
MWFPFMATEKNTKALSVARIIQQNTDKKQRQREEINTQKDIVDTDLPTTIMYTKLSATKRNKLADKSTDSNTIQSKRIDSEHVELTIPSTSNQQKHFIIISIIISLFWKVLDWILSIKRHKH